MGEPPPPPPYNEVTKDESNPQITHPAPIKPYPTQPGSYPPQPASGTHPPPPPPPIVARYPLPPGGNYPPPPPGCNAYYNPSQQEIVTFYPPEQQFSNLHVVQGNSRIRRRGCARATRQGLCLVVFIIFLVVLISTILGVILENKRSAIIE